MAPMLRPLVMISLMIFSISSAFAQNTPPATPPAASSLIRVRDVTAEAIRSPEYGASVRGMSTNRDGRRDWLQVKAVFDTAAEWTDEITFTFYVALTGKPENLPQGAKPTNVFRGTVTLINVPKARDHFVDMFLDANTFSRYGDILAVTMVTEVNGQPAALVTKPESLAVRVGKWWETEPANPIALLSRYESPYRLIDIDSQGTIQP